MLSSSQIIKSHELSPISTSIRTHCKPSVQPMPSNNECRADTLKNAVVERLLPAFAVELQLKKREKPKLDFEASLTALVTAAAGRTP